MTDPFTTELRQHLVASANERPGDGQLAAVVAGVSSTGQRHPLVAGLRSFPGELRVAPSRSVRFGLVAIGLGTTIVAALLLGGGGPPRRATASPTASATASAVALAPTPAVSPTVRAACPGFVPLTNGSPYGARLGSLFVSMDLPDGFLAWDGRLDAFEVAGQCSSAHPVDIKATVVTTVFADACHPETSGVAVRSYADAVQQLAAQVGVDTVRTSKLTLLNNYRVAGFQVSASDACSTYQLWNGAGGDDHGVGLVSIVDVDGVPLGILVRTGGPGVSPAQRDEADQIVSSVHVIGGLSADATNPPFVPPCIEFDASGSYTARVGGLPVGMTVPGAPSAPWFGSRDFFYLGKANCAAEGTEPIHLNVAAIDAVYADACHWQSGTRVSVTTAAEAATAIANQQGHATTGPVATTLASYPATRFDIGPVNVDPATCDLGEVDLWSGKSLVPGMEVYVIDVGGMVFGVTATFDTARVTATDRQQADAILQTLHVGP